MKLQDKGLFTRKYGQVLLKNLKVAHFEVSALDLPKGSSVLEIGPGPGTLTEILLEEGYMVTAIEPDHRFFDDLTSRFREEIENGHLKLLKGDFLEMEGASFDGIIGNVPYHISSAIVFRLSAFRFRKAVMMFQKEFCNRLVARTGTKDYSRLSVNAQLRFEIRIIAKVSRNSFYPVPEVDSSVVEIVPRSLYEEELLVQADDIFRKLFSAKRKKLSTILKEVAPAYGEKRVGEISPDVLLKIISEFLTR